MIKMLSATAIALLISTPAFGDIEFGTSAGWTGYNGDAEELLNAGSIRGTVYFDNGLGVEAEASFGANDADLDSGGTVEIKLDSEYVGYALYKWDLNDRTDLFVRLGYGTSTFSSEQFPGDEVDVDGPSFGIGGHFFLTQTFGLRADYRRFEADEDDFEGGLDVISVSAALRF